MESKFAIRQMAPNDRAKLEQIVDLSFSWFMGFFAKLSLREEGQVIVSVTDVAVVGFAKLIEFNVGETKFGCILWLGVHPDFRRKGIASAITNEGIKLLKQDGARAVFASTQRRNSAALRVLQLAGFRKMSILGLWRLFGSRLFQFYSDIWLAPGEVVLMHN